jgi:hypothetical protein
MSLLTKEDLRAAGAMFHSDGTVFFTNLEQLNAALLAKLASAELPEPEYYVRNHGTFNQVEKYYYDAVHADERRRTRYTADQLRQAYAQGAASQLSAEPFTHYRHYDEQVQPFADENTVPLYTRKEAK